MLKARPSYFGSHITVKLQFSNLVTLLQPGWNIYRFLVQTVIDGQRSNIQLILQSQQWLYVFTLLRGMGICA